MISLNNVSIQFGGRSLFSGVSLVLGPRDRIGLVGSNGTGKSTLLKIIAGLQQSDTGDVEKARYVTVGYLPQDGVIAGARTLSAEAESAFQDIVQVRHELDECSARLAALDPSGPEHAETLEVFGELQHRLEDLDSYRMRSKVEKVLMGLGFAVSDFERQTAEFSGGWQMRIALAKLLLKEPSLLLLDEPTNHLDLDSLQWLEDYLQTYEGAIILVSHDRAFLDSLSRRTLALRGARLESYAGNYSFYEREQRLRAEMQVNAYKNQQRQLEQTQRFIDRFRYKATKARQVQSRLKQLEKMERIQIEDQEEEIHFHFPPPEPGGARVMELQDVAKHYGPIRVFDRLNFTLDRGDRVAIVGVNGAGKSTFARILAGVEPIDGGRRISGHRVILSYFAQHQAEELDPSKEVLETVDEVATGEIRPKLRTLLGAFLFHGDDVFKNVGVLSGGEKSRLALAKMLLQPANLLIMDEPTNHLDMRSKKVLQDALSSYEGTFAIVSHDRAFLDPLVTKVIEVSSGCVRVVPGNVSEYLARKKAEAERERLSREMPAARGGTLRTTSERATHPGPQSEKERKRSEAEARQKLYKKLRPIKERLEALEKDIAAMETRFKEIETLMADPAFYKSGTEAKKISHEYGDLRGRLDEAYAAWNDLTEKLAAAQAEPVRRA